MREGTFVLYRKYNKHCQLIWKDRIICKIMRRDKHNRYILIGDNGKEYLACEEQLEELFFIDVTEGEMIV